MIVYAFPGQGSQTIGMGIDLACYQPLYTKITHIANQVLNFDIENVVKDSLRLSQTVYTQPALLWSSYLAYRIFIDKGGPQPHYVCGHSLGEYTALCAAGVLDFADALLLVHKRGEYMQQQLAPEESLMAVVLGLSNTQVEEICTNVCQQLHDQQALFAANYNAKGQVVVAGKAAALLHLQAQAKKMGAKRVLPLTMSVPSHCPLMQQAASQLDTFIQNNNISFHNANIPVIQNIDACAHINGQKIQRNSIKQLTAPVAWQQTMDYIAKTTEFIESGPGKVLQGLAKRALPQAKLHNIGTATELEKTYAYFT